MPDSLSAKEAAVAAGVSERTVRRWLASGHLKAAKRGRSFAISPEALAAISGHDTGHDGQPADNGQRPGRTADDSGHAPGVAELAALVREQQRTIIELSGQVGYFQARIQQLQAALEAPKVEQTTPGPSAAVEAATEPRARPWWRRWWG
jgi:excisionase family DNA binding protein